MATTQIAIAARDGWRLDTLLFEAPEPRAVAVVGHAMMVDRRTLWREGKRSFVNALVEGGVSVLLPDLRGHGARGPHAARGASWTYEDLIEDTAVYLDHAREYAGDLPLVFVGHSLFGHTTLAWLGMNPDAAIDGLVEIAVCVWSTEWTESRVRVWKKRAAINATMALARAVGYVPVRRLGQGTNDEPLAYWRWFTPLMGRSGRWTGVDGTDYAGNVRHIKCPVLHVASDGDDLMARPSEAFRITDPIAHNRECLHIGDRDCPIDLGGFEPDHMQLVMDPRCEPMWRRVAQWIATRDTTLRAD